MKVIGTVENIIFRNQENLYTVLELETEDTPVVATGIFPTLSEGETLELIGEYKETKYGRQFEVKEHLSIGFQSVEAMTRYLAGGLFKGVGEKTAKAITDVFKEKTFEIIETAPHRLAEVRGVTAKKAIEIAKSYMSVMGMREAVIYLTEKGLSFSLALKIFNQYKENTISVINRNAYALVDDIDGIGFKTADEIAIKLGTKKDSEFRIQASLLYVIKEMQHREGSTMIAREELTLRGSRLLGFETQDMVVKYQKLIEDLLIEGKLKRLYVEENEYLALSISYYMERNLANSIKQIQRNASEVILGERSDIDEFEKKEKIKLHEAQIEAVLASTKGGVTVITGGPGTGKTTIIKCIMHIFKKNKLSVALVAPTGRASKRLSESTGEEAKTIHRLLDLDFKNGKGAFAFNDETKLEQDVLIVDEVSMADVFVMKSLLGAVKFGGRVILVGDKDQLPSVGAGNVLKDILDSDIVPYVSLTQVYRQGDQSMIVVNAHEINKGRMPNLENKSLDFFYSDKRIPEDMVTRIVEMVTKTLPSYAKVPSKEIQILVPMKKGVCGVNNLNVVLQEALNPKLAKTKEIEVSQGQYFRVGDKVMQTINNYQLEWMKEYGKGDIEFGSGVFNGDVGEVISIEGNGSIMRVVFDDGRNVDYDRANYGDLTLAYAISIHKSQGSEFDVIIIPITGGSPMLFTRNLLYTGITRGKKLVVLMGDKYNIKRMVDNNYIEKRYTMLKYFLQSVID